MVSSNNTVKDIVDFLKIKIPIVQVELVESKIMNQFSYNVNSDKIRLKGFDTNNKLVEGISEVLAILEMAFDWEL